MKIVCLLGSPRTKGNSELIAQRFLQTAEHLGAEAKTHQLYKMNYRGCIACMGCKEKKETCTLKDDLSPVLEEIKESNILVIAAPVYYGDVPSQVKAFIDRTYCYLVPDFIKKTVPSRLAAGKKCVFILVQGHPDEKEYGDIYPRYSKFMQWYGFETHLIRATGIGNKGDVSSRYDILNQAEALAKKLIS